MPPSPTRAGSTGAAGAVTLAALGLGALLVVLAASPFKAFELDRFFVPKELALHATALVAGIACLVRARSLALDRVDALLLIFACVSVLSAILAPNHWLSSRSVAITISGLVVFWCSRALANAGMRRPLAALLLLAIVAGTASALAQAYGVESEYFTLSRAPGGLSGNRNFMAHLAAIGAPLLIWYAVTARRLIAVVLSALGAVIIAAGLVMSRSRAAWLAMLIVGVILAVPMWRAARKVPHADAGRRLVVLGAFAVVGAVLALALPNRLNWKSESPYLDSVRSVADYNSGSGRGRVIQYRNSLAIAKAHPVLGVGPGNWPVYYPHFAQPNDPSLVRGEGTTANPWPSSDWVTFISERGVFAVIVLLVAFVGIIANAFQSTRGSTANNPAARDPFVAVAVTAMILITIAVGMFDAVLSLATPSFIVWGSLGAMSGGGRTRHEWNPRSRAWRRALIAASVLLLAFTVRSAAATVGMKVYGAGDRYAAVQRASYWDPGSYRITARLAELALGERGCAAARSPAERASRMLPTATVPREILRRCGVRTR